MKRSLVFLISLLICTGCKDVTNVQTGYVSDRDQCRENSQNQMDVYTPSESYAISAKEKNVALLTLFCECMRQKDWKVAGCPKPKEKEKDVAKPAAPTPPPPASNTTVVVVQAPAGAQPAEEQAAPAPASSKPASIKHVKKKVCPAPQTVCPAPGDGTLDDTDTATLKKILGKDN